MFNTNFRENLKRALNGGTVKRNGVVDDLAAVLVPVTYLGIPTMLGLKDWEGWITAVGSTWLLGALFDVPAMMSGAIAAGAVHLGYSIFREDIEGVIGPLWNFTESNLGDWYALEQGGGSQSLMGLSNPGTSLMRLPDGQYVQAAYPTDGAAPGMAGWYPPQAQQQELSGWYPPESGMQDDQEDGTDFDPDYSEIEDFHQ